MIRLLFWTLMLFFAQQAAYAATIDTSYEDGDEAPADNDQKLSSGIFTHFMDTSVHPGDDFYQFVNGLWLEQTQIPGDRARWGSFDELREIADGHVLEIIRAAAEANAPHGSDQQKIGDMFRSFMNTGLLEELRLSPLSPQLGKIDALQSHEDLAGLWGYFQRYRAGIPISLFVGQDPQQSDRYITSGSQSGLGLPDRDFYLNDDDRSLALLEAYRTFIESMWELAGWDNPAAAAETVIRIETAIAENHWTRVENRDRVATYNLMKTTELAFYSPGFNWMLFLDQAGLGDIEELVVRQPSYFTAFAAMQAEVPVADWQTYLRFHLLRSSATSLSADFDEAHFRFYGQILSGQQEQRSRELRGVAATESVLGFMVGQKYVQDHFPREASERMDEMIDNLLVAFDQSIRELEWMTDATKVEALAKLSTFTTKIGYPEVWRNYDCLEIRPDELIGNLRRSAVCEYERNIGRLGQPIDTTEWGMTPQTVNAYYRASLNEIVFPAAILQPPFFDVEAEDAVNYGAIGAVIGHEISHGFDDQGRRSDGEGNLRDWWTEEDEAAFGLLAQRMIDFYSSFNPIDDMHINGALALGENIADLGGMNVAWRAYLNSLNGAEPPVIDGFTAEQRFLIGWGQIWRTKFTDEALRRQLVTGPHSPGRYRVLGIVPNLNIFYEAFEVGPQHNMYKPEESRILIW
ncbi:MAG: M13 family peptidase [Candidatus Cyclonatronum sp.]|uniref:M13 family metallopeptidase n=1 Tax=Cyclonatronum sp. TaxID=3024185 RepID=UPI0025C5396B|nr:M13-type metalloendopeptidase [Cyclonatronum sp.]MCH8486724.1 M13 family peptidase [Cyclonatronum sp.]